ncbi:MAG TPA: hypothetical protein EYP62_02225 [Kiritimatiellae bacterium]|nr:hypothetical protein [Kiritimatiellia bacterium]
MKITRREMVLGWLTLVVVLAGISFWWGSATLEEWKKTRSRIMEGRKRIEWIERSIRRRPQLERRFAELSRQLPRYELGQDVTAEILKNLERMARRHGFQLLRREPEKEKDLGDLFQVAVNCSWQGSLESLVHFLYDIQTSGAMFDIDQLTVSPAQGGPGELKGTLKLVVAYTRGSRETAGGSGGTRKR